MRVLVTLLLLAGVSAQQGLPRASRQQNKELRFALILARHGVRAPLSTADTYSVEPWPKWEVPAGHLTPHGAEALRQMGAYMRLDLSNQGLFSPVACPVPAHVFLYSDTDERNVSSTRATFEGFASGCALLPIHTVDPKTPDPLFRTSVLLPLPADGTAARRAALLAESPNVFSRESHVQLDLLSQVLAPDPLHPAEKSILATSDQTQVDLGDIITVSRPRSIASEIVEDLVLEYADGKPLPQVGWGRIDESLLRKLIPIRVAAFNLEKRTPFFARKSSSNMLAHILETLNQAASNSPRPGAFGKPGTRLVYISGHDGDLAGIAGLLGLRWTADGITDDTPPDAQIVFELWQDRHSGRYSLRMLYRAQTLDQLRLASKLTATDKPVEVVLTSTGCTPNDDCSLQVFRRSARRRVDPHYVRTTLMRTQVVP